MIKYKKIFLKESYMEINAAAMWLNTTMAEFDLTLTQAVHGLYDLAGGFFTPFFEFVSFLGLYGIILILLSACLILRRNTRRFGTAMLISLALGALLTNCVFKIAIARPRPFSDESSIYYELWKLVGMNLEVDGSFPSGHTTAAFAASTAIYLVGDKRISWTALLFGFLMAVARIYLVVHYPSDVIGGIIVGVFSGIVGTVIATKLPSKYYRSDFPFRKKSSAGYVSEEIGDAKCSEES